MAALYLDTSAVLRAILETGTTPELEERIASAEVLITSRLSLIESARPASRRDPRCVQRSLKRGGVWAQVELLTADERLMAALGHAEKFDELETTYQQLAPELRYTILSNLSLLSPLEPRRQMPDPTPHRERIARLMLRLEGTPST